MTKIYRPRRYHPWKRLRAEVANLPRSWRKSQLPAEPTPQPPSPPASSPQLCLVWERLPHNRLSSSLKSNAGLLGCWAAGLHAHLESAREAQPLHSLSQMAPVIYELELSSSRTHKVGQGHGGAPQQTKAGPSHPDSCHSHRNTSGVNHGPSQGMTGRTENPLRDFLPMWCFCTIFLSSLLSKA